MSIEGDIPTLPTLPTLKTHHSKLTLPKTSFDNVVLTSCKYVIIDFSFRFNLLGRGNSQHPALHRNGFRPIPGHQNFFEQSDQPRKGDADNGNQNQRRKNGRCVHRKLRVDNDISQPPVGSDKLTHNGADHTQGGADFQSGKNIGQRVGNSDFYKYLPFRSMKITNQIQ